MSDPALPPLSLYVHFPWCIQKCPYCDFNSHAVRDGIPEQTYLDALIRDLDQFSLRADSRQIQTIFFGGGTPSLISGDGMRYFMSAMRDRLTLADNVEITLEANPGTVDQANFHAYREAGVNRLSIGAQSMRNDQLKSLGRIHAADQVAKAMECARVAGFDNVNLDLMFALPNDDVAGALYDLQQAIALSPEHLSWYQLTLEPNTLFYQQPPALPVDDVIWEIQEAGQALLAEEGFAQYEISAYARSELYCQHNLNYWQFGDYLGIGAGAHSKLTREDSREIERYSRPRHPKQYQQSPTDLVEQRWLDKADRVLEYMMNVLRLNAGFRLSHFEKITGLQRAFLLGSLKQAEQKKLLVQDGDQVQPTEKGRTYHNDLLALFLPS